MNNYEALVRNKAKENYAFVYLDWIFQGRQGDPPKHPNLGSMAAQGVRQAIEKAIGLQRVSRGDLDPFDPFEALGASEVESNVRLPKAVPQDVPHNVSGEHPETTSFALAQGRRGVTLPEGGYAIFEPRFPVVPLTRIVADPLWRLLSKNDQRELRLVHGAALSAARQRVAKA